MLPDGFPQPYKQPSLPPSTRFPRTWEIDWVDVPPRLPLRFAPALVQQSTVRAITSGTTDSVTLTVTAGNTLILGVVTALSAGAGVVGTPTDPHNLWISATSVANTNSGGCRSQWWFVNSAWGGSTTITMTLGSAVIANWEVYEFSGVGAVAGNRSIVDASSTSSSNGTTPGSGNSLGVQQSGSLALQLVGDGGTATTWTKDASSTSLTQTTTSIDFATSYRVLSSTSVAAVTQSFTGTPSAVQFAWAGCILRPAGQQAIRRLASAGIASAATLTSASYTPQLGSVLLAFVQTVTTGRVTNSVSDTASESWSLVTGSRAVNASGGELSAWICNGTVSAAARTFSATPDAATAGNITIIELTGVVPCTGIVDQVATSTGNGTAISVTAGSATAIANELAILAVGAPNTSTSTQPGGSDALIADTSSANGSMGVTTRILNAVSSPNLTATLGTTRQYSTILITLKTGGVSFVQSTATNGTSGPNNNASLTFNSAPGDALLTRATVGGGTTMSTITDGAGNTYTRAISQVNGTIETSLWYAKSITGGKVTETLARSSSGSTLGAVLWEFSGLDTVNLLDTTGSTTGTGTTATPTSGVPLAGNVLSVIAAGDSGTGNAWSPSSPFVSVQAPITTNINNGGGILTTFTTTPAAISGSLTSGATTPAYAAAIAVFRIAGSPLYNLTRTISMSAALQMTLSRTVPQAAALSILAQTRDIPQSAGLQTTVSRQVPQSAAFQATLSRQIPESAALSVAALSRTVAQTAGFTILNRARQINQYAELSQVVTYLHRSGVLLEWGSEYEVMLATSDVPVGASGGTSRLTVEIRDHSTYRDPSTVMLLIDAPDGTRTQLTYGVDAALHRLAQGVYYSDLTRSQTGIYTVTWSDGTPQGWASDVVVST